MTRVIDKDMMTREKQKDLMTVRAIDGVQFVFMPDGSRLPCVIMTRVTDNCDESPTVLIKALCNVE